MTGAACALLAQVPSIAPAHADGTQPIDQQVPVELEQFTTETSRVMQMPDGTLELTSYREPVRVEQNGEWVDIDASLERQADGSIAPVATTAGVEFSAGGSAPLVKMKAGVHDVEIRWDGELPAPSIDGDTVTYAGVRTGVDLVLTSTPTGYNKALVIRDAAAARGLLDNPAKLTVFGDGLTFTTNADGHSVASDENGPVFTSAPAVLWDSNERYAAGADPTASDPGDSKVRRADAEMTPRNNHLDVVLSPTAEVVADSSTQYPLYVDPVLDKSKYHYLTVHSRGWDYYDDSAQPMRVGYCGWAECNTSIQGTARSYFSFDLSALTLAGADPVIYDATVYARQIHNATSSAQPVNLTKATAFSSTTNWPGPIGSTLQTISSSAGYGSTNPATLGFSSAAVNSYVQASANAEDSKVQFALSAPDSSDRNQWKKFANNPSITVKYGYPPTTPTDLNVSNAVKCTGKPVYVNDTTPYVYARSDERSSANYGLLYWFDVYSSTGTIVRGNTTGVSGASNALVSWPISPALPQGPYTYKVQAKVNDPQVTDTASAMSAAYAFTIDTVAPSAPTVSSFAYPSEYWGAAENAGGAFNLAASSDTAGFAWAIDGGVPAKPNNTTCAYNSTSFDGKSGYVTASAGKGTLNVGPNRLTSGHHTLTVMAFDGAHNASANSQTYSFYVAPAVAGSPGANRLEFESLVATQPNDQTDVHAYSASSTTSSGGATSTIVTNRGTEQQPSTVDYHFNVPADGYYALGARLATGTHNAKVRFAVAEGNAPYGDSRLPLLQPDQSGPLVVDTYSATSGSKYVPLGEYLPQEGVRLKPGVDYVISVEIVGTSGQDYVYNGTFGGKTFTDFHDNGYTVGLDSLTVAPLRVADFTTLADAFDNDGIGETAASSFSLNAADTTSLSSDAMTAAGIQPGTSATVGGVPFTIPNAAGKDNVISQGQSIAMPAGKRGSNVYLLAAANCGPITAELRRQMTIGYRVEVEPEVYENVTSNAPLMDVPDWRAAPQAPTAEVPASVTMPHYLDGSSQITGGTPTLYVLRFPVNADHVNDDITRITLPRVGTTYSTASCGQPGTQSLRVFALTIQ